MSAAKNLVDKHRLQIQHTALLISAKQIYSVTGGNRFKMYNNLPTIAFFGATGGSILACLVLALQNGYHCHARRFSFPSKSSVITKCTIVVRNPEKLKNLLTDRGIYDSAIVNNLTVTKGSVSEKDLVRKVLLYANTPVDIIIFGIGGKMSFENPLKPTLDNPTICQDAIRVVFEASRTLGPTNEETGAKHHRKPLLAVLSTTGISEKRDLPILMMPMYKWMLKVPHVDKKAMEDLIFKEIALDRAERGIEDYIIVRPSFLTDGKSEGLANIKVGTEIKPAVGYTISRNDVGVWLFQNAVRNGLKEGNPYLRTIVTITT